MIGYSIVLYLMKYNSKVFEKFKEFKVEAKNQTRKSIKILQLDWESKHLSTEFIDYLKACSIVSQ